MISAINKGVTVEDNKGVLASIEYKCQCKTYDVVTGMRKGTDSDALWRSLFGGIRGSSSSSLSNPDAWFALVCKEYKRFNCEVEET